ncbi:MAG: MiaB/RimO family radical SAM methylthiotransferase [Kiritimatiellia bacterium]
MNKPKYEIHVLGCKVNQYDAQQIRELLELSGAVSAEGGVADISIIHSCGVTATALQKSLQAVRAAHRKNPDGFAVMTGCCCALPGFVPPREAVACVAPHEHWLTELGEVLNRLPLKLNPVEVPEHSEHFGIHSFSGHTRAFLKIQNGCSIGCAYCIVPRLRGYLYDKPLPEILAEARSLAASGHKEIIVSGVSVGLYGGLAEAMRALCEENIVPRLGLSSLHPNELTGELLDVWASFKCMMPHIHLPLQSGSDRILKMMRRNYARADFLRAAGKVRDNLKNPAITTDVIVGFPGETPQDFSDTLAFCREIGFSRMHVFPFSPRPGTAAENMDGRVPPEEIKSRAAKLRALGRELARKYCESFIGRDVEVLVEQRTAEGICSGYTEHYVPVEFEGSAADKGNIRIVCADRIIQGPALHAVRGMQ